jgi:hypothetical protein
MNYEFCLNPLSLPVDTSENANKYLNDIFRSAISISMTNATTNDIDEVLLLNISDATIAHIPQYNWKNNLSDAIVFSEYFNNWYNELTEKNKLHIANLLKRADEMGFDGTIKQTKTIEGSAKAIREWRGGCPDIGSGRIRILYKSERHKFYILYGFIKTSENDYISAIKKAEHALKELLLHT